MYNLVYSFFTLNVKTLKYLEPDTRYRFNNQDLQLPTTKIVSGDIKIYVSSTVDYFPIENYECKKFLPINNYKNFNYFKNIFESYKDKDIYPFLSFKQYLIQNYDNFNIIKTYYNENYKGLLFYLRSYCDRIETKIELMSLYELGIIIETTNEDIKNNILCGELFSFSNNVMKSIEQLIFFSNKEDIYLTNLREISSPSLMLEDILLEYKYPKQLLLDYHCYSKDYSRYKELLDYNEIIKLIIYEKFLENINPIEEIDYIFSLNKVNPNYNNAILDVIVIDLKKTKNSTSNFNFF